MKHVVRGFSLVVLVALLATPFVSFAQGDPRCNGLSQADCQLVLQAAENMAGVTTFTIPSFEIYFELNVPGDTPGTMDSLVLEAAGNGAVSMSAEGGELVYLYVSEASYDDGETSESVSDVEVILTPDMMYVNQNGQWYGGEEQTDFSSFDMSSADFNTLMDQLDVDLTNVITTTRGEDTELHGQPMATFVTTVDIGQLLTALLSSPAVTQAMGLTGGELMSTEEIQMFTAIFLPMLEGTSLETEQWIGQDGYIHDISMDLAFNLDMTMFDPEAGALSGVLNFDLEMDNFNQPVNITIPTDYKPLDEMDVAVPDLGGLGQSLGGGM